LALETYGGAEFKGKKGAIGRPETATSNLRLKKKKNGGRLKREPPKAV